MSEERKYKFGDWVEITEDREMWYRARYVTYDGCSALPHWALCDGEIEPWCGNDNQIRPAPPPEGTEEVRMNLYRHQRDGELCAYVNAEMRVPGPWDHVATIVARIPLPVEPPVIEGEVVKGGEG